jgi:hypothetical protein
MKMKMQTITLPDGYNGHTVKCYVEPIEVDGNLVKLQVAEPDKKYMFRWARKNDLSLPDEAV